VKRVSKVAGLELIPVHPMPKRTVPVPEHTLA
jgi:hypothetical protein